MNKYNIFPRDFDTLCIIKEMEEFLGLKNKEIDKMKYGELIEYINELTLMLLYKQDLVIIRDKK